jgi:PAS domain S-box-containing protein
MENDQSNRHAESLAVLIDLIPDPALVIDSSGKIIAANETIGKDTGYTKDELIEKNFAELSFIDEEYKLMLTKNAKARLEGSNIPPYEIRITAKNGDVKCLKVNGNHLINKGEALDLAVFHDVTEENKIQNELRLGLLESEEKIQGITNSIKEAIVMVDEQARVTYWNPAAEKTFGYMEAEAVGKKLADLVIPQNGKKSHEMLLHELCSHNLTKKHFGYLALKKDGSLFPHGPCRGIRKIER